MISVYVGYGTANCMYWPIYLVLAHLPCTGPFTLYWPMYLVLAHVPLCTTVSTEFRVWIQFIKQN